MKKTKKIIVFITLLILVIVVTPNFSKAILEVASTQGSHFMTDLPSSQERTRKYNFRKSEK